MLLKSEASLKGAGFLAGGGEMGARFRAHDWSASPLGPPMGWPQALKTLVSMMLAATQPMFLAWGPGRVLLYNDAYAAMLAGKHPALGQDLLAVWQEIQPELQPLVEQTYRGVPSHADNIKLVMERRGYPEEAYFAYSYTPVRDERDSVAGLYCVLIETTRQVLAERRQAFRLTLEECLRAAATPGETLDAACEVLGKALGGVLCTFNEWEADASHCGVIGAWRADGMPSTPGRHRIGEYGPERMAGLLSGQPERIEDVRLDLRTAGTEVQAAYAALGCRASLSIPFVRDGRVRLTLVVGAAGPRRWSDDDVALATETMERTWQAAEHVRAEAALAASERALRFAIEAGRLGTWSLDLATGELTTSAICRLNFGRDPNLAFSYAELRDAIHPEDRKRMADAVERSITSGVDYDIEYRIVTPGGEVRWVAIRGQLAYADGAPVTMTGISIDVTNRRRTEDQLSESEARYRLMADAVPQIVWSTDGQGRVEFFNKQWRDYIGASGLLPTAEQVATNHVHPDDAAMTMEAFEAAMRSGGVFEVEHRVRRADGAYRWFLVRAEPYRDPGTGEIVRWFGSSVDIHDRKMAEAALRESEARYRTLFDSIDEGFCVVEFIDGPHGPLSDYVHREANPAYLRHAGIADVVGRTGREKLTESEADAWVAIFREVLDTGRPVRFERELEATDRCLEVACSRVEPAGKHQVAIIFQDVTARKRAEERLRELNETLESQVAERTAERDRMWDTSPDLMLVIDFEGYFRRVNPAWTALLGYSQEELVGRHVNAFVLPDDHSPTVDAYQTAAEGGRPTIESRYRHKDGSVRWISLVAAPAGDMTYATGRDITAEKERKAELAARTAERERLWNLSQDMLARASYDGRMSAVSPAWNRVLGWSESELLTRPYASFMHPEDMPPTIEAIQRMAETQQPTRFENRIATRDGSWKHIEWTVTPELDGENFVAVGRDLSVNKAREAELEHAREALRQSQKMEAVGQLTGGLAHDFNNLLAAISGGLQVLKLKLQRGQFGGLERYIDIGESSVRRAASLTQRLLAFSRRQTLDPKPTDVNRLIAGMEELVRRSVGPMVELEVVSAPDLWPTRVDPSQLENALLNLCINARDAMMPGGGKLRLATENKWVGELAPERDLPPGQYVALRVSDTGTGMSPEVVARIFDPFFTTKPLGEGTGLGLSMVYGFVRQSGGQVRVHSEVGAGTTMCLYLPRHAGPAQAEEPVATLSIESGQGETVLLIEDEHALRDIVEDVLRDAGYRVLTAPDGPTGLQILHSDTRVDLLVTDVGLPGGLNGRQVADAARVGRPGLKVLFITGYADTAAVGNGRLDPGMEVMTKPFEIGTLANKVRTLIDARLQG